MSEEYKHMCTFPGCEAKFVRPSKLEAHLRKHTGERPFECDEENCNKSYTNDSHLRRHKQRSHQKDNSKTYKCDLEGCSAQFTTADNLKRHKNNIHLKKNYECQICKEKFHKKCKLRDHTTQKHIGEITCSLCSITFENPADYKKHKYHHKTYTCSCGEEFHRWTVYLKHRRTVHPQKHICDVCQKEFGSKLTLNSHKQTHNQNRTVIHCPMDNCERIYYYKSNLKTHIETFHLKIKKSVPPSKQKFKDAVKEPKPPKTLLTGRQPRKDIKSLKKSSALKLVGLTVPYEAEKALIEGKEIDVEISTSEVSDVEMSVQILRRENNTSDSDSSTPRMIAVN